MRSSISLLWLIAAWIWTAIAGGGGLWLLIAEGAWPPTNGWFALLSGIAACPLLAWSLRKYAATKISGLLQFAIALFFFVAGHAALIIWPHV